MRGLSHHTHTTRDYNKLFYSPQHHFRLFILIFFLLFCVQSVCVCNIMQNEDFTLFIFFVHTQETRKKHQAPFIIASTALMCAARILPAININVYNALLMYLMLYVNFNKKISFKNIFFPLFLLFEQKFIYYNQMNIKHCFNNY